ncbi:MAG: hypothetical protein NC390_02355 [Fusobacterium sp.]|nr:hypothetical protein [Fusobacterium sp.]
MRILFNPNNIYQKENYRMNFEAKGPKFDTEQLKRLIHSGGGGAPLWLKSVRLWILHPRHIITG